MALDPLSLGLTLAPAVFRGITGLFQTQKKVERTDTTPQAFKEALQSYRLNQNALMPGYGQRANQLGQIQSAAAANALRGAGSSADALTALGAADARRQAGVADLGVRQDAYRDTATRQLNQGLTQQAAYQKADQERADQATAVLKGNGLSNLFGGLSDAASAGVYAIQQAKNPTPSTYGASGVPTTNAGYQIPYDQGDEYGYPASYRRRSLSSPFRF